LKLMVIKSGFNIYFFQATGDHILRFVYTVGVATASSRRF